MKNFGGIVGRFKHWKLLGWLFSVATLAGTEVAFAPMPVSMGSQVVALPLEKTLREVAREIVGNFTFKAKGGRLFTSGRGAREGYRKIEGGAYKAKMEGECSSHIKMQEGDWGVPVAVEVFFLLPPLSKEVVPVFVEEMGKRGVAVKGRDELIEYWISGMRGCLEEGGESFELLYISNPVAIACCDGRSVTLLDVDKKIKELPQEVLKKGKLCLVIPLSLK